METSYDALRALTSSKLRWGILESLESPKRLADLRRIVGANAPNTSTKAKDLQRLGLIDRDNGDYYRTCAGNVVHGRLSLLIDTLDTLYAHRDFWSRMLEHLPDEMLATVHEFNEAKLIRSRKDDLDRVKLEILRMIRKAESELVIVLPTKCDCILKEVERVSKTIDAKVQTLADNPGLSYGMVKTEKGMMLFTEMLDMALVKRWPEGEGVI